MIYVCQIIWKPTVVSTVLLLSAGFSVFVYWKFAVLYMECTICKPNLILPTHVLYISSGHFCAPEYCSVFARIQMSSAYTVYVLYLEHFSK